MEYNWDQLGFWDGILASPSDIIRHGRLGKIPGLNKHPIFCEIIELSMANGILNWSRKWI